MVAGKDGVQPGVTWCRAGCCLGALGRFGQDGQGCILPISAWLMLFFNGDLLQNCFWPSFHNTGQERLSQLRKTRIHRGEELLAEECFVCEQPGASQYMLEDKTVSLHRPLMLDNGISAPPVSKFSRHLSAEPLHEPYFIQSVGSAQPLTLWGGFAREGGMFEAIIEIME